MTTILARFVLFAAFWLVLTGGAPGAWIAGALACLAAAVLSARLLPGRLRRIRLRPALGLAGYFARESLRGGIDVAWRALHPRLPVQPGWVRQPLHVAPGAQRLLLADLLSLMPGTLAAGDDRAGDLLLHCLDTRQPPGPLAEALERRLRAALGEGNG